MLPILVPAIGLLVAFALSFWFGASSRSPFIKHHQGVSYGRSDTPLEKICYAHKGVAKLYTSMPDFVPTLFGVLELDPKQHPFHPPESCAFPTNINYRDAKVRIENAWMDMQASDSVTEDGVRQEWRIIATVAAAVLLDDGARMVYLRDVLPEMARMGPGWWAQTDNRAQIIPIQPMANEVSSQRGQMLATHSAVQASPPVSQPSYPPLFVQSHANPGQGQTMNEYSQNISNHHHAPVTVNYNIYNSTNPAGDGSVGGEPEVSALASTASMPWMNLYGFPRHLVFHRFTWTFMFAVISIYLADHWFPSLFRIFCSFLMGAYRWIASKNEVNKLRIEYPSFVSVNVTPFVHSASDLLKATEVLSELAQNIPVSTWQEHVGAQDILTGESYSQQSPILSKLAPRLVNELDEIYNELRSLLTRHGRNVMSLEREKDVRLQDTFGDLACKIASYGWLCLPYGSARHRMVYQWEKMAEEVDTHRTSLMQLKDRVGNKVLDTTATFDAHRMIMASIDISKRIQESASDYSKNLKEKIRNTNIGNVMAQNPTEEDKTLWSLVAIKSYAYTLTTAFSTIDERRESMERKIDKLICGLDALHRTVKTELSSLKSLEGRNITRTALETSKDWMDSVLADWHKLNGQIQF
ncbi:hypothetical protein HJFPF1_06093 [Paramyrothecium foliicola]|nr:hypothetical protein HJFPF1_06093 [Paramyrothecium foliicola]